jgi:hypothetical protein
MSQKLIDELYDGDAASYQTAIEAGNRETISWESLQNAATILPHLETEAQNLIEQRLGYLPAQRIILPHEPFIRALINSHQKGQLSVDDFSEQIEEHIKLIRNEDMEQHLCTDYDPAAYKNYTNTFTPYGQQAKNRITNFLGYEPKLEHSLAAEIWLGKMFAMDNFKLPDHITAIDFKVLTLIRYREILLQEGKKMADASPLLGIKLYFE